MTGAIVAAVSELIIPLSQSSRLDDAGGSLSSRRGTRAAVMNEHRNQTVTRTNNPVRISRIGAERLQVVIRPADGCTELRALVERLEQLIDVGHDAIDVVFESALTQGVEPMPRPAYRGQPNDVDLHIEHAHEGTRPWVGTPSTCGLGQK